MRVSRSFSLLLAATLCSPAATRMGAQQPGQVRMVSPSIDPAGQPFSYPSRPTDQIGVPGAPAGTEITPEGTLYTGYGELVFYTGVEQTPVSQHVRTLEDGYLPVVQYSMEQDGLTYDFMMFAASLGAAQDGTEVANFVRVTLRNRGDAPRRGYLTAAWRYEGLQTTDFPGGDDRFRRPVAGARVGDYNQPGQTFDPRAAYAVSGHAYLQNGKAIYLFPPSPTPGLTPALRGHYNRLPGNGVLTAPVQPTTPVAVAETAVDVPAHGERSLDYVMPLAPVSPGSPAYAQVQAARFDDRHAALRSYWQQVFARGIEIVTPEDKVNAVYKASLVNDLLALGHIGGDFVQTVNLLHYHGFYLRDSADFVRMYDTSGYSDVAGEVLAFFAGHQGADGNFLSQPGQYDGWGEAMWAYGEHYRMTHDKAFAAAVYPRMVRAVAWLQGAVANDPLHLVPATDVRDNEYVRGHLTGYNFLALDGLDAAVTMARDLGHGDDAARFARLRDALHTSLLVALGKAVAANGGAIPPALDEAGGTDWGNLLALVPEQQLPPFDPMVTATLRAARSRYAEGLITYRLPDQGVYLHHYLTMKNTQTELIRGEAQEAIGDLYAVLLHTTATNAGWEFSIRPWGDRDFNGNLSPHGWFAAEYRNTLRNMVVREDGDALHLLSAVSPAWIGAGKTIAVHRAPTTFGEVNLQLTGAAGGATLTLDNHFAAGRAPKRIVVHLPWWVQATGARVDGRAAAIEGSAVTVPPGARTVAITWTQQPLADGAWSYEDAVNRYQTGYAQRFAAATGR